MSRPEDLEHLEVLQRAKTDVLAAWRPGLWRFELPRGSRIVAGITDRQGDLETLSRHLTFANTLVQAEQIHGASLAAIESTTPPAPPIPGCDGLLTRVPGVALVIRTADCLPIFVWDPVQHVVGLAHVGWRGLASHLPARLISFVHQLYHNRPQDLRVGIGPAIRSCCYEVGKEFEPLFGPFVTQRNDRLTCDLIGCASQQLLATGVSPSRLVDAGECTACNPTHWHSIRRDGETSGRLFSFIMLGS